MVGYRQDRQCAAVVAGGEDIKLCGFHLYREDVVAGHLFIQVGAFVVKSVRAIDATDMNRAVFGLGGGVGGLQQVEIGARGEV